MVRGQPVPQDIAGAVQEPTVRNQRKHAELCDGKRRQKLSQRTIGKLGEVSEGGAGRLSLHRRNERPLTREKFCQERAIRN